MSRKKSRASSRDEKLSKLSTWRLGGVVGWGDSGEPSTAKKYIQALEILKILLPSFSFFFLRGRLRFLAFSFFFGATSALVSFSMASFFGLGSIASFWGASFFPWFVFFGFLFVGDRFLFDCGLLDFGFLKANLY